MQEKTFPSCHRSQRTRPRCHHLRYASRDDVVTWPWRNGEILEGEVTKMRNLVISLLFLTIYSPFPFFLFPLFPYFLPYFALFSPFSPHFPPYFPPYFPLYFHSPHWWPPLCRPIRSRQHSWLSRPQCRRQRKEIRRNKKCHPRGPWPPCRWRPATIYDCVSQAKRYCLSICTASKVVLSSKGSRLKMWWWFANTV